MATKTFTKDEAREILWGTPEYETVEDKITDTGRWSIYHVMVFREKATGKLFEFGYSVGATEHQEERPFENEETVEAHEVKAVEKTITVYEAV